MVRFILAFVLLISPLSLEANDYLILSLASWHHDRTEDYNEINEGFGLQLKAKDQWYDFYHFGHYNNSIYEDSYYFTIGEEYQFNQYVSYGYDVGLISGYSEDYPIIPFALPYLAVGSEEMNLRTYTVPGIVYGFQLRVGF